MGMAAAEGDFVCHRGGFPVMVSIQYLINLASAGSIYAEAMIYYGRKQSRQYV